MPGKLIIFSAPSGSGKTTLVHHLLSQFDELCFSISATSRDKRGNEQDGKDYHFLSKEAFEAKIADGHFIEWEEVYAGTYYGTLRSAVEKLLAAGKSVIFDVDVKGGLNIKKQYGPQALAIFVQAGSLEVLQARLSKRNTESAEKLQMRLDKAAAEMEFANQFDYILVNEDLDTAKATASQVVGDFLRDA
ncbi:MAG: guanylate kinase [Sphingobacteriaceae bacterium]|nr:guanylate kinase [Sphingobacteriaceae bacterium]